MKPWKHTGLKLRPHVIHTVEQDLAEQLSAFLLDRLETLIEDPVTEIVYVWLFSPLYWGGRLQLKAPDL